MRYHILAGDALAADFEKTAIDGEVIVCRECLAEGDLQAANLKDFWNVRAKFVETAYNESTENYHKNVVAEFEKLRNFSENAEVNLWFEHDLFCQANMWFCLSLLRNKQAEIYRVAPVVRGETEVWKGFGGLGKEDLERCFANRIKFSESEVLLGAGLWKAFQNKDFEELKELSAEKSACFPKLDDVCEAASLIEIRPPEALRKITTAGETDFKNIFAQFAQSEGIYGFGDSQVKRILQKI